MTDSALVQLHREVIACNRCSRLITYCQKIGREKRRAYLKWEYWAKPVPGWGDPNARVLILGLAPGAHGSNRTGRPFTGDGSGNFMYPVLHQAGFASQPTGTHREDVSGRIPEGAQAAGKEISLDRGFARKNADFVLDSQNSFSYRCCNRNKARRRPVVYPRRSARSAVRILGSLEASFAD